MESLIAGVELHKTAMWTAKHCTYVAKSGMSFLDRARAVACIITIWSSSPVGNAPLAGGNSP